MPWMRCPACWRWAERRHWRDEQPFPFHVTCPHCAATFDVAAPEYRIRPDDEPASEQPA